MRAVLVAGGDPPSGKLLLQRCREADLTIAADAGLAVCLAHDIIPDILVGDLDSAAPEVLEAARSLAIPLRSLPTEKDETDLERAAWLAREEGADEICILGAFGGRIDHLLGNLAVCLWCARHGAVSWMEDDGTLVHSVTDRFSYTGIPGQTLSIVPAGDEAVVSAKGLYYPLRQLHLRNDKARGISNVVTEGPVDIRTQGAVYVIINK